MKKLFLLLGFCAPALVANSQSTVTTGGQKYSVVEDVTGAWCQYCPDGTVRQEQILMAEPRAIGVALHNQDKMSFTDGNMVMASPNLVSGYPGGLIDRKNWNGAYCNCSSPATYPASVNRGYWSTLVAQQVATAPQWDVKMTHSFDPTTRQLMVRVEATALQALQGDYNLNVWVVEDSVIGPDVSGYNQSNYYNTQSGHEYYQAGNPIKNFVHRHVERAYLGGAWGTAGVIANNPAANSTYSKTYSYTIPAKYDMSTVGAPNTNLDHVFLVGMVMKDAAQKPDREIMNAIQARLRPTPTSVNDLNKINDVTVYPNPASESVTIKATLEHPSEVSISFVNTLGQVVKQIAYNNQGNLFGEQISVADLPTGMYMVKMATRDGVQKTERLSIVR